MSKIRWLISTMYYVGERFIKNKKFSNGYWKLTNNDNSVHSHNFIFVKQFRISTKLNFYYWKFFDALLKWNGSPCFFVLKKKPTIN